jgi:hypothetical protein
MKRITQIALLSLASLGASLVARAQQPALKVTVPFNFAVGEKLLPAGNYTITSSSPGIITVRANDRDYMASIVATHGYNESANGSKVVFDVYGDQYFLRHILTPSSHAMNVDIPTSKLEKNVRTREAMLDRGERTLLASK